MSNNVETQPRAKNINELTSIMQKFWNNESIKRGLTFKPKPDDVIISPFAKCGTTFLMQICHGLRTRGSMDFDEIMNVVPWIELAHDIGWDLEADQMAKPRLFKSHLTWDNIPKGSRYIVSFRHYQSNIKSGYRFLEGWIFEPGTISIEDFVDWSWQRDTKGDVGYIAHLASWWEQRNNENVLLLCFEDMIANRRETIHKIADFLEIELDKELLDIVFHNSSRDFMLKNRDKFDQHQLVETTAKRTKLPPPINADTVTPGTPDNDRYKLSEKMTEYLGSIWNDQITSKYGIESYEDLRQQVRKLNL